MSITPETPDQSVGARSKHGSNLSENFRPSRVSSQRKSTEGILNPSSNVLLFYPYGSTQIGRGDAITDNAMMISALLNWNISNDLGSAWNINFPLQATTYPITLSDTPD